MVVVKMPFLLSSILSSLRSSAIVTSIALRAGSGPRQYTFLAGPDEALHQQQQKYEHCDTGSSRKAGKGNGKGKQENGFHVEDQKHNCVQIIRRTKLNPRVAFGLEAALVGGVLFRPGFAGGNPLCPEPRQGKRSKAKADSPHEQRNDRPPGMLGKSGHSVILIASSQPKAFLIGSYAPACRHSVTPITGH